MRNIPCPFAEGPPESTCQAQVIKEPTPRVSAHDVHAKGGKVPLGCPRESRNVLDPWENPEGGVDSCVGSDHVFPCSDVFVFREIGCSCVVLVHSHSPVR